MKKENNKTADIACAPYAGSGKLSDYKKDGSWMMNQMEKGYDKCDRGIKIDKTDPEHMRFASIAAKIASESMKILKSYTIGKEGDSAVVNLKWMLQGDFDGATIDEMQATGEMLRTKADDNIRSILGIFKEFDCRGIETRVSFGKPNGIYVAGTIAGKVGEAKINEVLKGLFFEKAGE